MDAIVIFRDFSANATQQLGVTLLKRSFGGKVPGKSRESPGKVPGKSRGHSTLSTIPMIMETRSPFKGGEMTTESSGNEMVSVLRAFFH